MRTTTTSIILDIIREYIEEHGFSPSIRDIMDRANINSTSLIQYHLKKLTDQGCIERTPDTARSIVLLKTTAATPGNNRRS